MWTKITSTWPDNDRHWCNGLSLLIFDEKWPNYASGPKSAPNSDSFWVRRLFNVSLRVFFAQNATILLVYYIPSKIKILWKDDFFLPKSASSARKVLAVVSLRQHHVRWPPLKACANIQCDMNWEHIMSNWGFNFVVVQFIQLRLKEISNKSWPTTTTAQSLC